MCICSLNGLTYEGRSVSNEFSLILVHMTWWMCGVLRSAAEVVFIRRSSRAVVQTPADDVWLLGLAGEARRPPRRRPNSSGAVSQLNDSADTDCHAVLTTGRHRPLVIVPPSPPDRPTDQHCRPATNTGRSWPSRSWSRLSCVCVYWACCTVCIHWWSCSAVMLGDTNRFWRVSIPASIIGRSLLSWVTHGVTYVALEKLAGHRKHRKW